VAVDTTVQPKAVAHPTDARLMHRAITKLVGFAKRNRVPLRQSYLRLAKRAAIMVGRYTHAHRFKRARRQLKSLRTRLGRIIRDIRRKIDGDAALEARFGPLLDLAQRVRKSYGRPIAGPSRSLERSSCHGAQSDDPSGSHQLRRGDGSRHSGRRAEGRRIWRRRRRV
jgi:hypothetical protein